MEKIKIHNNLTIETLKGHYTQENKEWLVENSGKIFDGKRTCMNYYTFENEFICHIYQATVVQEEK